MHTTGISADFKPCGKRAEAIDLRMHSELCESLAYLRQQFISQMEADFEPENMSRLELLCHRLSAGEFFQPAIFANYYRLCMSLAEGTADAGNNYLDALLASKPRRKELVIRTFDSSGFENPQDILLYRNALDTDDSLQISFMAPDEQEAKQTKTSIENALSLMNEVAPEFADEFSGLVHDIILAESSKIPGEIRFDGASSYQLWGALAINVEDPKSELEMMETLAHESAHSFLFGMTIDEPLVHNLDSETYASPLRTDLRPMDGIFHATFVSARMHSIMWRALESEQLTLEQQNECMRYLKASRVAFENGWGVVQAHGKLSSLGTRLIHQASLYMESKVTQLSAGSSPLCDKL